MRTVVITGGGGYIGGQTAIEFKEDHWRVVVVDRNPQPEWLKTYIDEYIELPFDDPNAMRVIVEEAPDAIIHCAGSSLVGPSVLNPKVYYDNNLVATKNFIEYLMDEGCHTRFVFSSSAAVYGEPVMLPIREEDPKTPLSPYGVSKLWVEQLLETYGKAYDFDYVGLRYFNAAGADPQGRHGQVKGATHIIARVMEAIRDNKVFTLFGDNLPTDDGTCVRDYIHVADIARAHRIATEPRVSNGFYNLSTGLPASNLEILTKCCNVSGSKPQAVVKESKRPGDPDVLIASADKFREACNWQPLYHVDDIVEHAWQWYTRDVT